MPTDAPMPTLQTAHVRLTHPQDRLRLKKLIKTKKLQLLSAELVETAEIRLQYPEMSLDELKNMFPTPITKSGLNHRLHRLTEEADGE